MFRRRAKSPDRFFLEWLQRAPVISEEKLEVELARDGWLKAWVDDLETFAERCARCVTQGDTSSANGRFRFKDVLRGPWKYLPNRSHFRAFKRVHYDDYGNQQFYYGSPYRRSISAPEIVIVWIEGPWHMSRD